MLFLRNQSLQELAEQDIKMKVYTTLCDNLIAEFKHYVTGNSDIKPRFLCELLNITHGLHLVDANKSLAQWKDVESLLESLRGHIPKNRHFQDVKKAYNKTCAPLKIQVIQGCEKRERSRNDSVSSNKGNSKDTNGFFDGLVETVTDAKENGTEAKENVTEVKENGSEENENSKKQKKSKKKKKKSNEDLQKQKERKIHNIEGQFEGLPMPSFSGLALTDNMNFETTEKTKKVEKTHKKPKSNKV